MGAEAWQCLHALTCTVPGTASPPIVQLGHPKWAQEGQLHPHVPGCPETRSKDVNSKFNPPTTSVMRTVNAQTKT